MNDHSEMEYSPQPPLARPAPPADDDDEPMDNRLRRLEHAIAALQDTRLMEERLLQRVSQRLDQQPPAAGGNEANALLGAGKALLPGMIRAVGSQLNAATSPNAAPSGSVFSAKTWIVTDIIQEIRTFFVLYFDYRYRPSTAARMIPPAALVLFLLSWIGMRTFAMPSVVGAIFDYLVNFFLVVLVYRTLQREAARYRSTVAYLPPI